MMAKFFERIGRGSKSVHFDQFKSHSKTSFGCVGGNPALLGTSDDPKPNSWDPWLLSVRSSPASSTAETVRSPGVLGRRLDPISDFLIDSTKRDYMKQTILKGLKKKPIQNEPTRTVAPLLSTGWTSIHKADIKLTANNDAPALTDKSAVWMVPGE
jgi:hypothetical protein